MGKAEENKTEKRKKLMDHAFALFTEKGIAHTSIAEIADRAGVAKGTFYLYFKDKYDIEKKLIAYITGDMFQHAIKSEYFRRQTAFPDALIAMVDDVLDQLERRPEILRFINKNLSWGIFRQVLNEEDTDYMALFTDLMEREGSKWKDPDILFYTIIEMVSAACYSVILEGLPMRLSEYKPYLYDSIRAIIDSYQI